MNVLFTTDLVRDLRKMLSSPGYTPKTKEHMELMNYCLDSADSIEFDSWFYFVNNKRKKDFNNFINLFSGLYCRNDEDYKDLVNVLSKNTACGV